MVHHALCNVLEPIYERRFLWDRCQAMIEFLQTLRLLPNPNSFAVRPLRTGIDFLGFRVYPDHRRLLPHNVRAARQRMQCRGAVICQAPKHRRAVLREFCDKRTRHGRIADLRQEK